MLLFKIPRSVRRGSSGCIPARGALSWRSEPSWRASFMHLLQCLRREEPSRGSRPEPLVDWLVTRSRRSNQESVGGFDAVTARPSAERSSTTKKKKETRRKKDNGANALPPDKKDAADQTFQLLVSSSLHNVQNNWPRKKNKTKQKKYLRRICLSPNTRGEVEA